MTARVTLQEQFEELDRMHGELRRQLHDAIGQQRFSVAERNHLARRLERLRAARELVYRMMSERGDAGDLLPPDGDLFGALRLVQLCLAGNDEISTAFREQIVKVEGSVTLGQFVDTTISAYAVPEARAA